MSVWQCYCVRCHMVFTSPVSGGHGTSVTNVTCYPWWPNTNGDKRQSRQLPEEWKICNHAAISYAIRDMAQRNNVKIRDIVNEFGCMWYFLGKNHNSPWCFLSHSNLMQYLYWGRQMIAWWCWDQVDLSRTPVFAWCTLVCCASHQREPKRNCKNGKI